MNICRHLTATALTASTAVLITRTGFIGDGEWNGRRILEAATVQEMRRQQVPQIEPTQGLIWYYSAQLGNNNIILGHNGGDDGVATEMFYRVDDGIGFILLMNIDWSNEIYYKVLEIEKGLLTAAEHIPG